MEALRVFPNPAVHELVVDYPTSAPKAVQLVLTDAFGRAVLAQPATVSGAGEEACRLKVGHLKAGLYILTVQGADGRAARKVQIGR